jgi:malic enzyme
LPGAAFWHTPAEGSRLLRRQPAAITDGSAVLGLGKVGPLVSKRVMEGKVILLKHCADIDVFDIRACP